MPEIIACILQGDLDVRDHFVGEQITVSVDWPVVIVIAVERIITKGWIPVASVEELISGGNEYDRVAMIMPPVAIMPFVPMTMERIQKVRMTIFVAPICSLRVFWCFARL